jgi:hypothetical protein
MLYFVFNSFRKYMFVCFLDNSGNVEEFEDTKGVIRIRKSKQNRQHNDQKDNQRSTKIHIKLTRTPLKTGNEIRCFGRVSSSCPTSRTRRV